MAGASSKLGQHGTCTRVQNITVQVAIASANERTIAALDSITKQEEEANTLLTKVDQKLASIKLGLQIGTEEELEVAAE